MSFPTNFIKNYSWYRDNAGGNLMLSVIYEIQYMKRRIDKLINQFNDDVTREYFLKAKQDADYLLHQVNSQIADPNDPNQVYITKTNVLFAHLQYFKLLEKIYLVLAISKKNKNIDRTDFNNLMDFAERVQNNNVDITSGDFTPENSIGTVLSGSRSRSRITSLKKIKKTRKSHKMRKSRKK